MLAGADGCARRAQLSARHPQPVPLDLHGAPDLQALAQHYGYAFSG
jgi:hypothetical protein